MTRCVGAQEASSGEDDDMPLAQLIGLRAAVRPAAPCTGGLTHSGAPGPALQQADAETPPAQLFSSSTAASLKGRPLSSLTRSGLLLRSAPAARPAATSGALPLCSLTGSGLLPRSARAARPATAPGARRCSCPQRGSLRCRLQAVRPAAGTCQLWNWLLRGGGRLPHRPERSAARRRRRPAASAQQRQRLAARVGSPRSC